MWTKDNRRLPSTACCMEHALWRVGSCALDVSVICSVILSLTLWATSCKTENILWVFYSLTVVQKIKPINHKYPQIRRHDSWDWMMIGVVCGCSNSTCLILNAWRCFNGMLYLCLLSRTLLVKPQAAHTDLPWHLRKQNWLLHLKKALYKIHLTIYYLGYSIIDGRTSSWYTLDVDHG